MRLLPPRQLLWILAAALIPLVVIALMMGPVVISPGAFIDAFASVLGVSSGEAATQEGLILSAIRLPRVLLAGLVGVCLAVCGAAMQGLFRNPLADPSLIGVTAGASLGAAMVIVLAGNQLQGYAALTAVSIGAFTGGVAAVMLVYRLATSSNGTSVATMAHDARVRTIFGLEGVLVLDGASI